MNPNANWQDHVIDDKNGDPALQFPEWDNLTRSGNCDGCQMDPLRQYAGIKNCAVGDGGEIDTCIGCRLFLGSIRNVLKEDGKDLASSGYRVDRARLENKTTEVNNTKG